MSAGASFLEQCRVGDTGFDVVIDDRGEFDEELGLRDDGEVVVLGGGKYSNQTQAPQGCDVAHVGVIDDEREHFAVMVESLRLSFNLGADLTARNAQSGVFSSPPASQWMNQNAGCFGFNPYVAEPWHFSYNVHEELQMNHAAQLAMLFAPYQLTGGAWTVARVDSTRSVPARSASPVGSAPVGSARVPSGFVRSLRDSTY